MSTSDTAGTAREGMTMQVWNESTRVAHEVSASSAEDAAQQVHAASDIGDADSEGCLGVYRVETMPGAWARVTVCTVVEVSAVAAKVEPCDAPEAGDA